jgi:hypothetical protein
LAKKTGAFGLLAEVSDNMGSFFRPFVAPLLPIITQHMVYQHSSKIRKFALTTFKNILIALGEDENI